MKKLKYLIFICVFSMNLTYGNTNVTYDTMVLPEIKILSSRIKLEKNRINFTYYSHNLTSKILNNEYKVSPVEILNSLPGIDVRQRGPHGTQSDISIRGGGFEQNLIMVDGIPYIDCQTGHHVSSIPLSIFDISNVELVKGPAIRKAGVNGFNGVINFLTTDVTKNTREIQILRGQYDLLHLNAKVHHLLGNHSISADGSFNKSDGYKYNTDYENYHFKLKDKISLANGDLKFFLSHSNRDFGANGFYASPNFKDQHESVKTWLSFSQLDLNLRNNWSINTYLSYKNTKDDYIFTIKDPELYHNKHTNQLWQYALNINKIINSNSQFGFGGSAQLMDLKSNNLGSRNRTIINGFVDYQFSSLDKKLVISPGLNFVHNDTIGNSILPGLELGYKIGNKTNLYANYGQTYRLPSFTELFYNDRANTSNPNLKAESADNYEIGINFEPSNNIRLNAAVFYNHVNNQIDYVKNDSLAKWQPINTTSVKTKGFELSIQNYFSKPIATFSNIFANYTYLDISAKTDDYNFSRISLNNLRHQLNIGITNVYGKGLYSNLVLNYRDRIALDNYMVLNAKLGYELGKIDLFIQVSNLFDQKYTETNLVEMPGSWFTFGFTAKF